MEKDLNTVKQKAEENATKKYDEAKEESRRKMDEVKVDPGEPEGDQATLQAGEKDAQAKWGIEEERGCGGMISNALGGVKDAIVDKITQHPDETGEAKTGYGLAVNDVGTAVLLVMDDDDATHNSTGAKAD